jgi:hypothetical protein
MSFKLKIDTSVWDNLKKSLKQAEIYNINLGWFEGQNYGPDNDNISYAQVAQWNNEGHVNGSSSLVPGAITPPRPFMSVGLPGALKAGANKDDFNKMVEAILNGKSVLVAMQKSTNNFERTLRKVMLDWDTPRNAPLTVEIKGFDNPLVNSSELIANVTAKVEKRTTV